MDYARKIGKPDTPKKWVRQFTTTPTTRDEFFCKDPHITEDRRLVNWKKWLANRKKQYQEIEVSTGRQKLDQTINACETVRPLVEMRTLMDYANVPVPVVPDKYRGGPEFWRTPEELPTRGKPCLPKVTLTPTKKELNIAPELTFVDLPKLMEKEKNLVGLSSKDAPWKRSKYLKKRKAELSKEIELLIPKEPETKNLVIEGHAPRPKPKLLKIPPITVSDTEEGDEDEFKDYPYQVAVLKIQDREIVWQRPSSKNKEEEAGPITWQLSFATKVNRMVEEEIIFENKGNRVIVYQWRDAAFESKQVPMKRRISPFYFNKTKGVIPPGQFVTLKIWYRPRASGVFSELWRLLTEPELCTSLLIFRFWGCAATEDTGAAKCNPAAMVDKYLDRCIRDSIIREIVGDIMKDIRPLKPAAPLYSSLFLESDVFEAKNPLCFYRPSILIELHKLYYTVTNQTKQRWNLSLNDLRETLLSIKQPDHRHKMLLEFSQLYKECLKPALRFPSQYEKYQTVYNLLCSFLNQFESESDWAKSACLPRELRGAGDTISEMETIKSINPSQVTVKSSNSRNKRGRKSAISMQSAQVQESVGSLSFIIDARPYREMFFLRIYKLLETMMEQVSATIDSFNNLNERVK
ncbi:MYCBP-associated protein [Calliopsis andreniformis]|uniref:MYCBP-associated protein n=1 Tax=Calliopsis andreniformis TaxID=337506 RepID=UPI003FCEE56F